MTYDYIVPVSHHKIHTPVCNSEGHTDPAPKNIYSKQGEDRKSDNSCKDGMHKAGMQTNHN